MRRISAGFTLVELLVTLAMAAILLALATPGFNALREEWALRAATHAVLGGLAETRLAALSRASQAQLCPSADGLSCTGRGTGFLVRVGTNEAAATMRVAAFSPLVEMTADRPAATYYAWPRAALPVTLTLCAIGQHARSRLIVVSQTGRPRVTHAGHC